LNYLFAEWFYGFCIFTDVTGVNAVNIQQLLALLAAASNNPGITNQNKIHFSSFSLYTFV